jgi:GH25 family lysozyme M1 (1,4-beta-N-acetylmuramidase)
MTILSAALAAALNLACAAVVGTALLATPASAAWNAPWKSEDKALVIDAYEFNPINWQELASDKRIAGFINKASDGLPPQWNCGKADDDAYKLCKNRWWKYSVTKELYMTRREMAKMKGLLWGAYHLARPGNPREQADHFIDFAEPAEDDLIALDIEDISDEWMSLSDAEIFADQVKIRTGRYPVLYTNGNTAEFISKNKAEYPLLSRLPLWYARYREDITGKFPEETWPSYALWQFSSMHNCNTRSCPYRVKGAKTDIDVNVAPMDVAELRQAWPFNDLIDAVPAEEDPAMLIASVDDSAKAAVAKIAVPNRLELPEPARRVPEAPLPGTLAAAYAPAAKQAGLDPLQLLADVARKEHEHEGAAGAVALAAGAPQAVEKTAALSHETARKLQAHIGTLRSAIAIAADEVDRLFIGRAEAATRPGADEPDKEAGLETITQRSRFVEVVKAATAAREAGALPMPARILSQFGGDTSSRGPRVTGDAGQFAELALPDQRILGAFAATR